MNRQGVVMLPLIICLSVFIAANSELIAQEQTVGLFVYDSTAAFEGYTLFAPWFYTTTYLIDNSGRVVHSWNSNYRPGLSVYLTENGHLLHTGNLGTLYVGGGGGIVQEFDWDGNVVWEFVYCTEQHIQHHDIKQLPNGNILMIAKELKSYSEAIAAGRNHRKLSDNELWPDLLIEVEPDSVGGTIVWEWHVWDHLVQDFDSTKANYSVVADHPELIDVNYSGEPEPYASKADCNHSNSVDYNPEFDQIVLSVRNVCEIWVIDHSTTTEEAAGHTGGRYGRGGDLLYRWGNAEAYRAGTSADKKLFFQHDAQWINPGLPGEGNILIFNNGQLRPGLDYSSVDEIIPPVDSLGYYFLAPDSAYGPDEPVWTYVAANPLDFYSHHISGAQRLANGNTLICDGLYGTLFEVTPEADIVWRYVNPVINNGPVMQGDTIPLGSSDPLNKVFKTRRYAPDFPGFIGHSLIPGDPIELYPTDVGPILINCQTDSVTLNWNSILNPLTAYYIYASDEPGSGFSLIDQANTNSWLSIPGADKKFYRVTFEVAP